jgi:hypothetical protein
MGTVSIKKQPSFLTAGENPIILELTTPVTGITESYSLTSIKINNGVTAGVDFISFNFSYPSLFGVRFNSSASPAGANEFLSSGFTFVFTPTTFTNQQIAQSLNDAIRTNIIFNQYYNSWVSGDTVYIKARIANQRFALATSSIVSGGNNLIVISNPSRFTVTVLNVGQAKYQGDILPKYGIWTDLYVADNSKRIFSHDAPLSGMSYVSTLSKPWQYNKDGLDFDLSNTLESIRPCLLRNVSRKNVSKLT